jgi:hypothetical protein
MGSSTHPRLHFLPEKHSKTAHQQRKPNINFLR